MSELKGEVAVPGWARPRQGTATNELSRDVSSWRKLLAGLRPEPTAGFGESED